MADEGTVCVCPQCGKKYRLKAGFEAASFSCKACAATVWVKGKPPAPKVERGGRRRAGAGRTRGRSRAAAGRRGRRRGRSEEVAEGEERRGGYERPKSNANLYIAIGGLALIGIIVVIVIMTQKDSPPPVGPPTAQAPPTTNLADQPTPPAKPAVDLPKEPVEAPSEAEKPTPRKPIAETALAEGDQEENPAAPRSGSKQFGASSKKKRTPGTSRWDAPATLGHLKSTPPAQRKQIDEFIGLLMDPQAGRDSLDAKQKLAAIGKPAFPAILGAMARVRDTIGDTDTIDERLIESSLKLADECLREMDGYLVSKQKAPIRPGTDKKYIVYIIRLHYRRWKEALEAMPEMPGPYDPSVEYEEEGK
ncbi:MAG: hypothetical protein ACYS0K_09095 [Planctomycetota bacterium]|jgi:DNA-directed RNA polymerase subunit RPC12/RpoP